MHACVERALACDTSDIRASRDVARGWGVLGARGLARRRRVVARVRIARGPRRELVHLGFAMKEFDLDAVSPACAVEDGAKLKKRPGRLLAALVPAQAALGIGLRLTARVRVVED